MPRRRRTSDVARPSKSAKRRRTTRQWRPNHGSSLDSSGTQPRDSEIGRRIGFDQGRKPSLNASHVCVASDTPPARGGCVAFRDSQREIMNIVHLRRISDLGLLEILSIRDGASGATPSCDIRVRSSQPTCVRDMRRDRFKTMRSDSSLRPRVPMTLSSSAREARIAFALGRHHEKITSHEGDSWLKMNRASVGRCDRITAEHRRRLRVDGPECHRPIEDHRGEARGNQEPVDV